MSITLDSIITKHAAKGLVVDAHILLLFIVGSYQRSLISRFKRTQVYTSADFDLLKTLLGYFRGILVTPHILAEVNSLMGQMPDPHLGACRKEFLRCIDAADESHSPSSDAAHLECFAKFGLTDSTICQLSANHAVLTDDFPLAGFLAKRGADVINFNHLRSFFD